MLLLTGPAGSGKTHFILNQVRVRLRAGSCDFRLVVPTATMAEHLRNQLAREGLAFSPGLVLTFSKLLDTCASEFEQAPPSVLPLVTRRALESLRPGVFRKVLGYAGFERAVAGQMEELSSAGVDSETLARALTGAALPRAQAFHEIYRAVETDLIQSKRVLRGEWLRRVAVSVRETGMAGVRELLFDGFQSLTASETEAIAALAARADVLFTLPEWTGAEPARAALVALGFGEQRLPPATRQPDAVLVVARTFEEEIGEIAHRILELAGAGRPFHEIAVVLRSQEPYSSGLQTAFERFGIPARFYFAEPLAETAAVRYLSTIVEGMLAGWPHELVNRAVQMSLSGIGGSERGDRLDFAIRERLPGYGLPPLEELEPSLAAWAPLESWQCETRTAAGWTAAAQDLRALVRLPALEGRSQATVEALRSTLAALDGLEAAFEQTAKSLGLSHRVPFAEFWRAAQAIMREMRPRIPDHRHNVVHVIDAYEARQWRVPIVFLCGLLEKQFPKYRAENPVLGDEVRLRLRRLGFRLSTAAESQQEEEFLFETAMTRADSELILSYPRFNRQGEENLPSFLLARVPARCENALAVRPRPGHEPAPLEGARIRRDEIRERIREKHTWFRPTALESFLQCPFQFFFRDSVAVVDAPRAPQDRVDVQLKGSIVHRTIARWHQARLPIHEVFERVYEEERATKRLPEGYRVEAAWTDMLLMLESYEANPRLLDGWKVDVERPFELRLDSGARLRGRIDRLDISPEGSMVIYDFKTSGEQRVKELVAGHEDGRAIQGGLYLAALEGAAGMLYWSLRGEPSLQGWHIALAGLEECGESVVLEALREIRTASLERAGRAAASIASGVIDVQPLDPEGCRKCEARDVCRVAVVKKTKEAGGNG